MSNILYPYMPAMPQCNNCGECCGPASATDREVALIREYVVAHHIRTRDGDFLACPFLGEGKCLIYEVRPWVCRMFGVTKQLPCPHFPEAAIMDFPAERAIVEGWMSINDTTLMEVPWTSG
jgi:hypothetical protein